jgi:hypothetical protein
MKKGTEGHDTRRETVEAKWERLARARNYRCAACGMIPPHRERSVFFARGLCGWCAGGADRDNLPERWTIE